MTTHQHPQGTRNMNQHNLDRHFSEQYSILFILLFVCDACISILTELKTPQLIYIGPFLIAIICAEAVYKAFGLRSCSLFKRPKLLLLIMLFQGIFLSLVVYKGQFSTNGVGVVFILQLIFSAFGFLSAHVFQWVRIRKHNSYH